MSLHVQTLLQEETEKRNSSTISCPKNRNFCSDSQQWQTLLTSELANITAAATPTQITDLQKPL